MSLELAITEVKRLVEAEPVFKPATPANIDARKSDMRKKAEAKAAARIKSGVRTGLNIKYLVKPMPKRQDSFWYDGDVAEIEHINPKTGEWRRLTLTAQGDINMTFANGEEISVSDAIDKGYTDKMLAGANFENNNWFEFWYESDLWDGTRDIDVMSGMDVMGEYDEGIALGVDIIQDDKQWHNITDQLTESINEAEPVFKAATIDQQAMRRYPTDAAAREQYVQAIRAAKNREELDRAQRRIESERKRAFYTSLPYTYEDITKLNAYDKIMHMGNVTDSTTDIMKVHRTTSFLMSYPDSGTSLEYAAYANGSLRSNPRGMHPSRIVKLEPALTLEAYGKLLDRIADTMARSDKEMRRDIAYYKYRVMDKNYNTIELVYYKKKVDDDYVKQSLIRDGYDPSIHVMFNGVKRGEIVREKVNQQRV